MWTDKLCDKSGYYWVYDKKSKLYETCFVYGKRDNIDEPLFELPIETALYSKEQMKKFGYLMYNIPIIVPRFQG